MNNANPPTTSPDPDDDRIRLAEDILDREPKDTDPRGAKKPAATLAGKVVAIAADGKSFTLEPPTPNRRDEAKRTTVTLGDKTQLTFSAIGPGGAKLTEGMHAQVWIEANVTVKVALQGKDDPRQPDFQGRVTSVAADKTSLTFESRSRGGEATKLTIKLKSRTSLLFSGVGPDGAKIAEGLDAAVFLARGTRDEASRVLFQGTEVLDRDTPRPDHMGRVISTFADFKGIMLQSDRGLPNLGIKFDDKTRIIYQNVGMGGARPVSGYGSGYIAQVWIGDKDGSVARMVVFQDNQRDSGRIVHGYVLAVGGDGKSFTLQRPPQPRSEVIGRPDILLTERTRIIYQGVGPGGARLTTDYAAEVWLEELGEGVREFTASQVVLGPMPEERRRER